MCDSEQINLNGIKMVYSTVCEFFGVDEDYIRQHRRPDEIVFKRHMFVKLAVDAGYEAKEIGKFLGFDRTTMMHSETAMQDLIDTEPRQKKMYEFLKTKLGL